MTDKHTNYQRVCDIMASGQRRVDRMEQALKVIQVWAHTAQRADPSFTDKLLAMIEDKCKEVLKP